MVSVKRNIIANYLGGGWSALMALAFIPIYIHYLGIEAYGLIGVYVSLQGWFALLDMGLSPTINREMSRFTAGIHTPQSIRNLLKSIEVIYTGIAVLLGALVIAISSWIATDWLRVEVLSIRSVTHALMVTGLIIALRWVNTLYRSAILGLQHQVWLNSVTATFATIRGVGTIGILAFISPTIQAFFLFQAVTYAIETAILARQTHHYLPTPPQPPKFSVESIRGVWSFAAGMTLITFLATILTQVDKLLLSTLLPLEQFGYFTLASTVAGALSILVTPISNVAYPRFTELVASGAEQAFTEQYHKFAQLLTISVVPATLILSLFSHQIIYLWTQNAATTLAVAPILSIWVIGTALNGLMHVPYMAQLAHGWSRLTVIVNTIAAIIIIPAFLIFVPRYGVMAAAWIWVAINAGYILFAVPAMHLKILTHEKWKWYGVDVFAPLLTGLVVALAMLFWTRQHPDLEVIIEFSLLTLGAILVLFTTTMTTPLGRHAIFSTLRHVNGASR
jgi:O-antigen/teichoic acid export membrane protein